MAQSESIMPYESERKADSADSFAARLDRCGNVMAKTSGAVS